MQQFNDGGRRRKLCITEHNQHNNRPTAYLSENYFPSNRSIHCFVNSLTCELVTQNDYTLYVANRCVFYLWVFVCAYFYFHFSLHLLLVLFSPVGVKYIYELFNFHLRFTHFRKWIWQFRNFFEFQWNFQTNF